jgi:hypothetical protein
MPALRTDSPPGHPPGAMPRNGVTTGRDPLETLP